MFVENEGMTVPSPIDINSELTPQGAEPVLEYSPSTGIARKISL